MRHRRARKRTCRQSRKLCFPHSTVLVATFLVLAMAVILMVFPWSKDLMTTIATGAVAVAAVMNLPRGPSPRRGI